MANDILLPSNDNNIAHKYDDDKIRMDLLPTKALEETAKVFTYGANKYNDYNWAHGKGLDYHRLYGALLRHLNAFWKGENIDESGYHHLAHASCNCMMLLDLVLNKHGIDDRFVYKNIQSINNNVYRDDIPINQHYHLYIPLEYDTIDEWKLVGIKIVRNYRISELNKTEILDDNLFMNDVDATKNKDIGEYREIGYKNDISKITFDSYLDRKRGIILIDNIACVNAPYIEIKGLLIEYTAVKQQKGDDANE